MDRVGVSGRGLRLDRAGAVRVRPGSARARPDGARPGRHASAHDEAAARRAGRDRDPAQAPSRRFRPVLGGHEGVAGATAVGLWLAAALVRPGISSTDWLHEAIHTDRAGDAADVFNQSLNGMLQRVGHGDAGSSTVVWALAAAAVLVIGMQRARTAHLVGDELTAVALVGLAGVLASPISWVHHAVWIVPVTGVLLGDGRTRGRWVAWGATMLLFLADVPLWGRAGVPLGPFRIVAENAFVIALVVLLVMLPIDRDPERAEEPDRDAATVVANT